MLMQALIALLQKVHPHVGPGIISGCRYGFADIGVQTFESKDTGIDWRRTQKYATFGFLQNFLCFNPLYMFVYPKAISRLGRFGGVTMSMFDAVVPTPLIYFPIFYGVSQHMQHDQRENQSGSDNSPSIVEGVVQSCRENLLQDAVSCALFWVPV